MASDTPALTLPVKIGHLALSPSQVWLTRVPLDASDKAFGVRTTLGVVKGLSLTAVAAMMSWPHDTISATSVMYEKDQVWHQLQAGSAGAPQGARKFDGRAVSYDEPSDEMSIALAVYRMLSQEFPDVARDWAPEPPANVAEAVAGACRTLSMQLEMSVLHIARDVLGSRDEMSAVHAAFDAAFVAINDEQPRADSTDNGEELLDIVRTWLEHALHALVQPNRRAPAHVKVTLLQYIMGRLTLIQHTVNRRVYNVNKLRRILSIVPAATGSNDEHSGVPITVDGNGAWMYDNGIVDEIVRSLESLLQ